MRFECRPATEADREFLWRLHRATMRPSVGQTWGWDEADQRRRFDLGFAPQGKRIVLVHGEPVGMIDVERREREVFLAVVEILPVWQGRGLGTRLIRAVIEEAGTLPVALHVLKVNPARRLYERLGFVVVDETETHYYMWRMPERRAAGGTSSP